MRINRMLLFNISPDPGQAVLPPSKKKALPDSLGFSEIAGIAGEIMPAVPMFSL